MVKAGRTIFSQGYGYADVEMASRVTPDSIFQVASVSKTVTATAMMLLWQDGAFKLDDPIAPLLDFPVVNPAFPNAAITFRQLFTHTSSISDMEYYALHFATGNVPALREFLVDYLAPGGKWYDAKKCYSHARPGTAWRYCNVAVALLGHLGEKLSGKSLDVFTHDRIFKPLGMSDTSWRYEGVSNDRLAQPYDFVDGHFKRLPRNRYPDWPAGLLCTSANDFAKFLASYNKGTLLKPETRKLMFKASPVPVHSTNGSLAVLRQGLIWELEPANGGTMAFHGGGDPGAMTVAAIDITHGTAVLCFANITPRHSAFNKEVIDRLFAQVDA
jgi:CubicO group peptidase (beta-lactamase class C family)